ncbi:Protein mak11 [Savitreella phatthalungensis]
MKRKRDNCAVLRVVVGSYNHVLHGFDILDGTLKQSFLVEAHTAAVKSLAIRGRYLASGGADEVIRLYDLKRKRDLGSLLQHDGGVTALAFTENATHLLSADDANKLVMWRAGDWTAQVRVTTRHGRCNGLAIHETGKVAITVGDDKQVRLWNLVTGKKAAAHAFNDGEPLACRWLDVERYVVISSTTLKIFLAGKVVHSASYDRSSRLHCIEVSKDAVLLGREDGQLERIDATTMTGSIIGSHASRIKSLATVGHYLVSGSSDGVLKLWHTDDWRELASAELLVRITCLAAGQVEMDRQTERRPPAESSDFAGFDD